MSVIDTTDIFPSQTVRELSSSDFGIGSLTPIYLQITGCNIILFYSNELDVDTLELLGSLWSQLASNIAPVGFYSVNASRQQAIMKAFLEVEVDVDHPLHLYKISGYPTILVYRNGWPQAFYNGEYSYDSLYTFITTLACRPGYKDTRNTYVVNENGDVEVIEESYANNISSSISSSNRPRRKIDIYDDL